MKVSKKTNSMILLSKLNYIVYLWSEDIDLWPVMLCCQVICLMIWCMQSECAAQGIRTIKTFIKYKKCYCQ